MFENVAAGKEDFMQNLKVKLANDSFPGKVDLGSGVYRNEQGQYHELSAVKKVRSQIYISALIIWDPLTLTCV